MRDKGSTLKLTVKTDLQATITKENEKVISVYLVLICYATHSFYMISFDYYNNSGK